MGEWVGGCARWFAVLAAGCTAFVKLPHCVSTSDLLAGLPVDPHSPTQTPAIHLPPCTGPVPALPLPPADCPGGVIPPEVYDRACIHNLAEALDCCARIGYPAMLKASWGGGGKGIRKVGGRVDGCVWVAEWVGDFRTPLLARRVRWLPLLVVNDTLSRSPALTTFSVLPPPLSPSHTPYTESFSSFWGRVCPGFDGGHLTS